MEKVRSFTSSFLPAVFSEVKRLSKTGFWKKCLAGLKERLRYFLGVIARYPGGAFLLSLLYFGMSAARAGRPIKIFWDGHGWYRIENGIWIPLGPIFPLGCGLARTSLPNGEDIFALRRGWWFRHYSPKEGDVILDIGAGYGEDAWVFSQAIGSTGKVLSIEAHPSTFRFLKDFVKYNRLQNVFPIFVAVSRASGSAFITNNSAEAWQLNSTLFGDLGPDRSGYQVPAQRLDALSFIPQLPRIDFIKMNIEGAELLALEGAIETLSKTQHVCICCHDFLGQATATKENVCRLLKSHGFDLSFTKDPAPPYERDFVYGKKLSVES